MRSTVRVVAVLAAMVAGLVAAPAAHAIPDPGPSTVDVTRTGLQLGTVTDSDGQINCGTACTGSYASECLFENTHGACMSWAPGGTQLSTTPPPGFGVVWSAEGCSGNSCWVAGSQTVNVHFDDLSGPVTALSSPGGGYQRGTIALAATATDPQTGINGVQFAVGGVNVGARDTVAPYSVNYDTTSRSDGAATVTATAYNVDGDATTVSAGITIDNTAPEISSLSGPNAQTYGPGSTQTWSFARTDATSGVAATECSVVPAGSADSFGACSGGSTGHSVTGKPGGHYVFKLRVRDNAGLETVQSRTFSIDAVAPDTSITSGPADGSSSEATSVTFGLGATEAGSTYECRVYPAALTPPAFGSCSAAAGHTASGFAPGTYAFEARAIDQYGNVDATPAKRTFVVKAPATPDPDPNPDPDPGTGGNPGTGGTPGTGGGTTTTGEGTATGGGTSSGTGTTGTGTGSALVPFSPPVRHAYAYSGSRTRLTMLTISGLPKDAKLRLSCKGKGCRFKKKAVKHKGGTVKLAKLLKKSKLGKGATLELRITAAGGQVKVVRYVIQRGKAPRASYRCAAPGAQLGACG